MSRVESLKKIASTVRKSILKMTAEAGSGHYMSSFSCVEILVSLYFFELRLDRFNPDNPDRDRFILSKGHAAPALYAVLAEFGYISCDELMTLRKIESRLQGHPISHRLPGLDASSGSLGQGLSTGIGIALAGKIDKKKYRVFVLLGDGECQEGQIWEAAMAAAHYKLENLVAIIDKNGLQMSGPIDHVLSLGNLAEKWRAFGWEVIESDGHNFERLIDSYGKATKIRDRPVVIIASTVKGYGVPFIENNLKYHTAPLNKDELASALKHLSDA